MRLILASTALLGAIATGSAGLAQTGPEAAGSITRDEARRRIEAAGYAEVEDLRLDHQGVWRGQAARNGAPVTVAVDRRGSVMAGPGAAVMGATRNDGTPARPSGMEPAPGTGAPGQAVPPTDGGGAPAR